MAKKQETKSTKCKICNCNCKIDIEIMRIVHNNTLQELANYYFERTDERINISSVKSHFDNHVTEKDEVQIRYIEHKRKENLVGKNDSNIEVKFQELLKLDEAIREATDLLKAVSLELKRQLNIKLTKTNNINIMTDEIDENDEKVMERKQEVYSECKVSGTTVNLYSVASQELRQLINAKFNILGTSKEHSVENAKMTLIDMLLDSEEDETA